MDDSNNSSLKQIEFPKIPPYELEYFDNQRGVHTALRLLRYDSYTTAQQGLALGFGIPLLPIAVVTGERVIASSLFLTQLFLQSLYLHRRVQKLQRIQSKDFQIEDECFESLFYTSIWAEMANQRASTFGILKAAALGSAFVGLLPIQTSDEFGLAGVGFGISSLVWNTASVSRYLRFANYRTVEIIESLDLHQGKFSKMLQPNKELFSAIAATKLSLLHERF